MVLRSQSLLAIAAVLCGPAMVSAFQQADNSSLNGWYSCSDFTFSEQGDSTFSSTTAECAVYNAPLCYPGICEDATDGTLEVFVKRIPAYYDVETAANVWLLQGGPGASSVAMESAMSALHSSLSGLANVYTMDHRGTGRSNLLDCVASQATTSGSPGGAAIVLSEVPDCAKELETKYGSDLSIFSVTSAATDMATFISTFQAGTKTHVYGVSYGTAVVERLIHLAPEEVIGYILDGVSTTSGSDLSNFEYFSTWDKDYGEVGEAFMELCASDYTCSTYFTQSSLSDVVKKLVSSFEKNPNSTCAAMVRDIRAGGSGGEVEPASYTLRKTFAVLLKDSTLRVLIPVLAYRLTQCNDEDFKTMSYFFKQVYSGSSTSSSSSPDDLYQSNLLYYLIVFSEMWETPEVSYDTMVSRFTSASISSGSMDSVYKYCAFSQEKSSTCSALDDVPSFSASPIVYKKDKYWNVAAEIPSQASVLLMNGKLDPQTPYKYATYLLDALVGDNKQLVTFDYATHGILFSTPSIFGGTCGLEILASYVLYDGDLSMTDTSCSTDDSAPDMYIYSTDAYSYFGTYSAYTGDFYDSLYSSSSSSSSSDESTSTSTSKKGSSSNGFLFGMIVGIILFVVALIAAIVLGLRYRKAKAQSPPDQGNEGINVASTPTSDGMYRAVV